MNDPHVARARAAAEMVERFLDEVRDRVKGMRAVDDARGRMGVEELKADVATLVRLLQQLEAVRGGRINDSQSDSETDVHVRLLRAAWSLIETEREIIRLAQAGRA